MYNKSLLLKVIISSSLIILATSTIILTEARPNANLIVNSSFETTDLSMWNSLQGIMTRDNAASPPDGA